MKYKIIEKSFFLRSVKVAAPLSSVVGFIGDFLQPVIEYASMALIASAALTLISGLFWFGVARPKLKLRLELNDITSKQYEELANSNIMASAFSFFFIFCFISGAIFGGQKLWAKDNQGIIATQVPELASLQKRILKLESKIEEIKVEVAEVKKEVSVQKQDLAQVKEAVEDVSKIVGPILEPKTKADHFNNATFYYKSGNLDKGKSSLEILLQDEGVKFDEVLQVFNVIVSFHGTSLAASLHQELTLKFDHSIPLKMAKIKLYDIDDKNEKAEVLRKIIEEDPHFTPAYSYLISTYFANMPKSPEQFRIYFIEIDQLLALLEEKPLKDFYALPPMYHLDNNLLKIELSRAQELREKWDYTKDFQFEFEIGYRYNAKVKFAPTMKIVSLLYSFDNEAYIDPKPERNFYSYFALPEIPDNASSIFIKYKTEDGVEHGPIEVKENFFEKMVMGAEKKIAGISTPSSRHFDLYYFAPALNISKQVVIKTQKGERIIEVPRETNILSPELFQKKYASFLKEKIQLDKNDPVISIQLIYRNGQKSAIK